MISQPKGKDSPDKKEREIRVAEALRLNLLKRKQQQLHRQSPNKGSDQE